ncbi:5934_t:CDS:2 [Ambispora gerdemannii]|uniref:5934_t:CDS:1 n=1 Tax=Ambispora gerdemannii TaxID=144530 RepID=A0A9N8V3E7_9GLOM|nr:5934_t:CDS:2 [Ambispora gerdemannii]
MTEKLIITSQSSAKSDKKTTPITSNITEKDKNTKTTSLPNIFDNTFNLPSQTGSNSLAEKTSKIFSQSTTPTFTTSSPNITATNNSLVLAIGVSAEATAPTFMTITMATSATKTTWTAIIISLSTATTIGIFSPISKRTKIIA